ncbi:YbhN family protein [Streptomyces sp. NPDC090306]|uniref:lysylphosphatidylglycerol synthase transmembrane domain-containing protein n=1 Tax=Streptomyces sp. NPDC090306 TaxID=3365961 RepID=UPI003824DC6C
MSTTQDSGPTTGRSQDGSARRPVRSWLRRGLVVGFLALFAVELVLGWPALSSALSELRAPRPGWFVAALVAELAAMAAYARMQRRLLLSGGLRVPLRRELALTYAAHSLNETLPGGPAFSTRLNYQQMRRFGATPALASWCIALSGILSTAALAVITAVAALAAHGTPPWLTLIGTAVGAVAITVGLRRVVRRPDMLLGAARPALRRLNRLRRRDADDGLDHVRAFLRQLRGARLSAGHGTAAAVFALLNWLLDAACLWLCLHAVTDREISGFQLLLAFCAGMAAGTVTIVPGGLGVIDNALVLGLLAGGIGTSTAIAAVVLYRLINLGVVTGAGWILWFVIRRRQPSIEPESP